MIMITARGKLANPMIKKYVKKHPDYHNWMVEIIPK